MSPYFVPFLYFQAIFFAGYYHAIEEPRRRLKRDILGIEFLAKRPLLVLAFLSNMSRNFEKF